MATALKTQNHRCNPCGLRFISNDWIELNHKDGDRMNFQRSNLEVLTPNVSSLSTYSQG